MLRRSGARRTPLRQAVYHRFACAKVTAGKRDAHDWFYRAQQMTLGPLKECGPCAFTRPVFCPSQPRSPVNGLVSFSSPACFCFTSTNGWDLPPPRQRMSLAASSLPPMCHRYSLVRLPTVGSVSSAVQRSDI